MSITINLTDDLAQRLARRACDHQQTVEEYVVDVLMRDADVPDANGSWNGVDNDNRRRVQLIRKSVKSGLTKAEQAELNQLQEAFDRKFEGFDDGLRETLAEMKTLANS